MALDTKGFIGPSNVSDEFCWFVCRHVTKATGMPVYLEDIAVRLLNFGGPFTILGLTSEGQKANDVFQKMCLEGTANLPRRSAFFKPYECDCSCHRSPGEMHIVACCGGQCDCCRKFFKHLNNHADVCSGRAWKGRHDA